MRLPSFNDLFPEQRLVYTQAPDRSILVVGPPGSGKTSTAIWRARILSLPPLNRSVVLVTRNRLLTALAAQLATEHDGMAIDSMTMSTLLGKDYWRHFRTFTPQWAPHDFRWDTIMADYAARAVEPAVDHLIVDEGQNLPVQFFIWARRFYARAVSVFADENQTTDANGCQVAELARAGFDEVLPLVTNHRNTQDIVDLVEVFHVNRTLPLPPASRGRTFDRPRILAIADWPALVQTVVTRFRNRGGSIGVILYHVRDIAEVYGLLRAALGEVRVDQYTNEMEPGGEQAIRMRDPGVTVISGESATGLEFDTVYLQDLCRSLPRRSSLDNRRLYMLCARARDTLVLVNGPTPLENAQLDALPLPPILDR
jgi:DNA helicase IV